MLQIAYKCNEPNCLQEPNNYSMKHNNKHLIIPKSMKCNKQKKLSKRQQPPQIREEESNTKRNCLKNHPKYEKRQNHPNHLLHKKICAVNSHHGQKLTMDN